MPILSTAANTSARGYGAFGSGRPVAAISLSNTSGSAISNYTFPIRIPYNSRYATNFSNLRFSYSGQEVQHWVATHTTSSVANVYVKLPSLISGQSSVIVSTRTGNTSSNTGMFKTFTDFPSTSLPSGWEVVSNGALRTGPTATNFTLSPGVLRLCSGGGGPVSILSTTSNQGVNISVDVFATAEYDTNNIAGQNSIFEVGMHGRPTEESIDLTYGFKYRWDARYNFEMRGVPITRSRSNNVATIVLNQSEIISASRNVVPGDVLQLTLDDSTFNAGVAYSFNISFVSLTSNVATITTSANHNYVPGDSVTISGASNSTFNGTYLIINTPTANTFTYFLTASNISNTSSGGTTLVTKSVVSSVSTVGDQITITYANNGSNVSNTTIINTSVSPSIPAWFVGVKRRMNQGYLVNPYGGTYTINSLVNNAGWNNFDDPYKVLVQSTTAANGVGNVPSIFRLRHINGEYRSFVDNIDTQRSFTDTGFRTGQVRFKSLTSNIATIETYKPHGLAAGDTVTIAGVDSTFNGTYIVRQVTGERDFNYSRTAGNVTRVEINVAGTSFSAASTRFNQNGRALVASHVGAAQVFWVAIYDTFAGVSSPAYALA
jgi:hypothetical protein